MQFSERVAGWLRFVLDECLPPIVRDQRWFYAPLAKLAFPRLDLDFKVKAPWMSDAEFAAAYEALYPMKHSDMTEASIEFVLSRLVGDTVLEVGCGNGTTAMRCARAGYTVTATDIAAGNVEKVREQGRELPNLSVQQADLQVLPFGDRSFDTTLCLHTLEHVLDFHRAVEEIKRVTRRRLIVIVPRERFFRYSANYHLHFFAHPSQLLLAMGIEDATCEVIEHSLCFVGDLQPTTAAH